MFGLDEKADFAKIGVYNAQHLQRKVMEYGEQMTPVVRPVFTVYEEEVYSYEAFRKKYREDIRPVEQVRVQDLDQDRLAQYVLRRNWGRGV